MKTFHPLIVRKLSSRKWSPKALTVLINPLRERPFIAPFPEILVCIESNISPNIDLPIDLISAYSPY